MGTDSSYCDNIVVENFGIELLCSKGFSWWILPIVVMKRYMGGLANAGIVLKSTYADNDRFATYRKVRIEGLRKGI